MPPGDFSKAVPPVPIPNTEVKLLSTDDTDSAGNCGKYDIARRHFGIISAIREAHFKMRQRGVEQWQLVGLITRRSLVQIQPPLPIL